MRAILKRLDHLTQSTRGLLLMATAWDALSVALLGMFSGPMQKVFNMPVTLVDAERTGRIIMLYHALAVPFVAAITYLILDMVPTTEELARAIRRMITPGYMLTSIGALAFAYVGRNWIFHVIFLLGHVARLLRRRAAGGGPLALAPSQHRPRLRSPRFALSGTDGFFCRHRERRWCRCSSVRAQARFLATALRPCWPRISCARNTTWVNWPSSRTCTLCWP